MELVCGVNGCTYTHTRPSSLGRHKLAAHGVKGTSAASLSKYRKAQPKRKPATKHLSVVGAPKKFKRIDTLALQQAEEKFSFEKVQAEQKRENANEALKRAQSHLNDYAKRLAKDGYDGMAREIDSTVDGLDEVFESLGYFAPPKFAGTDALAGA